MLIAMTGGAANLGMLTFMLLELGHLISMTGQTRLSKVIVNGNYKWGMRVIMTGGTVVQLEMRGSFMALATLGDYIFPGNRWMTIMAFDTGNLSSVGGAVGGDIFGCAFMTFNAVIRH